MMGFLLGRQRGFAEIDVGCGGFRRDFRDFEIRWCGYLRGVLGCWFCVADGFDGGFVLRVDLLVLLMVGFSPFRLQIGGFFGSQFGPLAHYCEILDRLKKV